MVKQRSPRAGPAERSSGRHTLPEDIAPRIALPITLLASWFIIWALLSNIILLSLISSSTPTQLKKDCFPRRNPRRERNPLHLTKKNTARNKRSVLARRSNQAPSHRTAVPRAPSEIVDAAVAAAMAAFKRTINNRPHDDGSNNGGFQDEGLYNYGGMLNDGSSNGGGPHDDGAYDKGSLDDGMLDDEGTHDVGLNDDRGLDYRDKWVVDGGMDDDGGLLDNGWFDNEGLNDDGSDNGGVILDDGSFDDERPNDKGTDYKGGMLDDKGQYNNGTEGNEIKIHVVGQPKEDTTEEMTDEGLDAVNRITLLMSDMIEGLEVMEVGVTGVGGGGGVGEKKKKKKDVVGANDGTLSSGTRRSRRRRRSRWLKDETMSNNVYEAQEERGGRVIGSIIAKTMSDKELFVDFMNGDAHGYGPVQVDSEGSLRWRRRRKRNCCRRGRRRIVMMRL
jgi:hypothetical protein